MNIESINRYPQSLIERQERNMGTSFRKLAQKKKDTVRKLRWCHIGGSVVSFLYWVIGLGFLAGFWGMPGISFMLPGTEAIDPLLNSDKDHYISLGLLVLVLCVLPFASGHYFFKWTREKLALEFEAIRKQEPFLDRLAEFFGRYRHQIALCNKSVGDLVSFANTELTQISNQMLAITSEKARANQPAEHGDLDHGLARKEEELIQLFSLFHGLHLTEGSVDRYKK